MFAQCTHYGRHWLCRAAKMHGKGRNTHGKGFAVRRRTAKTARQSLARQRVLCRASLRTRTAKPLPCGLTCAVRRNALPCALTHCRAEHLPCVSQRHARQHALLCRAPSSRRARQTRSFALRLSSTRTVKNFPGIPRPAPGLSFAVRMRTAKLPNGPLPCAYARQRPWDFSFFFCFH